MLIDDLPRLTEEERDALNDGYVTIEGVPLGAPLRRCSDCRHDLGDPMRALGCCPLFGKRRAGVVSRCTSFVLKAAPLTEPNPPCRPQLHENCR
jgi:hypothetical protein